MSAGLRPTGRDAAPRTPAAIAAFTPRCRANSTKQRSSPAGACGQAACIAASPGAAASPRVAASPWAVASPRVAAAAVPEPATAAPAAPEPPTAAPARPKDTIAAAATANTLRRFIDGLQPGSGRGLVAAGDGLIDLVARRVGGVHPQAHKGTGRRGERHVEQPPARSSHRGVLPARAAVDRHRHGRPGDPGRRGVLQAPDRELELLLAGRGDA